ncbi:MULTISPECIES: hypothetical protein [unclassified Variovorax]|uniref:hypothetical protein n=1 Tax=unclassified Variovorax TaxID=663243 RepID=UPI001160C711|nr:MULTISPECIES: hypothetical protein [unclassified Variovorax]
MLLSMAAFFVSVMTYAQGDGLAVAERLVRAMRTDKSAIKGTLVAYLKKPDAAGTVELTDGQRRDFLRCLEETDTPLIVHALANVLVRQLSLAEMEEALVFYNSSAGRQQVEREQGEVQRMLGYELAKVSPAMSGRGKVSLDRFRRTSAYAKLQEFPAQVNATRETRMEIYQDSQLAAAACSRTVGLAR